MKRLTAVLLAVLLAVFAVSCKKEPASAPVSSSLPSSSLPSSSLPSSSVPSSSEPSSSLSSSSVPSSSASSSSEEESSLPSSSESSSSSSEQEPPQTPPTPPPQTPTPPNVLPEHLAHYCYPTLTDIQKQYYNAMHTAVHDMHSSWIVLGKLTDNYAVDIAVSRHALVADHPDIFWVPSFYITAAGTDDAGNPAALMMFSSSNDSSDAYLVNRTEKSYMQQELTKAVSDITSQVTATDPFEIELQLHDLLLKNVTYTSDTSNPMVFTAYGALVDGSALCEGYSRAMQLLLHQFGIPCTTVTGVAEGIGHMWNVVKLGDKWYNLDATWNDSAEYISHEYFNLTNSEISIDHTFAQDFSVLSADKILDSAFSFNVNRPQCNSTEQNYFAKKGFTVYPEKMSELASYIISSPDNMIEVKFSDQTFKKQFAENPDLYLEKVNNEMLVLKPDCNYYIGRYSVSTHTVKFYKTEY